MWACQPIRVEVTFEPKRADAVIQEFADRKVNHTSMLPHPAQWLHMSLYFFLMAPSCFYSRIQEQSLNIKIAVVDH